jgi:hypothetical protein
MFPDVLTTTSAEKVELARQAIKNEYQRITRTKDPFEHSFGEQKQICLYDLVQYRGSGVFITRGGWDSILFEKIIRLQMYFDEQRAAEIRIIPPENATPPEAKPSEPPEEKSQQQYQSPQGVEEFLPTVDEEG